MDRREFGPRGDHYRGNYSGGHQFHSNPPPTRPGANYVGGNYLHGAVKGNGVGYGPGAMQGGPYAPVQRGKEPVSVWIGKIGTDVLDRYMRSVLELLGTLSAWRRHTDPKSGQPKSFGFAEFFSPRSAVLAKSLLNDLQMGDSRLLVKIDEKNQKIIDEWLAESSKELPNETDEKSLLARIENIAQELNSSLNVPLLPSSQPQPSSSTPSTLPSSSTTPIPSHSLENPQISLPHSDSSSTSISAPDTASKLDNTASKKLTVAEARREEERKRDFEKKLEMMEEAREREQRRVESNEKQYRILDRELEASQQERTAGITKRKKNEEEAQRLRMDDLARENALNWPKDQYESLEHDLKARLMSHDFVKARLRERDQDELDREEEELELRAEMRRADERHKEQVRLQQEEQAMRMKEEVSKRASKATTSSDRPNDKKRPGSELPIHATSPKMAKQSEHHLSPVHTIVLGNMPSSTAQQVPQTTADSTTNPISTGNTQALTSKIPSDSASLFGTPIRWDLAEKYNLLDTKIRPWVTKKIVEYLEFEEPTMIQFICTHIKERKPAKELIAQLKIVLDDEAEVFVVTLWRMLLLESLKMEADQR